MADGVRFCFWFFLDEEFGLGSAERMPRRLRIQYPGATYHVMSRGNGRQDIVEDDDDRRRLMSDLERASRRSGWEVLSFVTMSNHLHLMVRTPRPNLADGMQHFLSAYASWFGRRRRRLGHLFQGRYKAEMIEDESYFWIVSRYVHLNPVRAGMVERPEAWPWSSYPGFVDASRRLPWVDYDQVLKARGGEFGGTDPAGDYRRFVEAGLVESPRSPFLDAFDGWALGSQRFIDRLRGLAGTKAVDPIRPEARRLTALDPNRVCTAVADYYGVAPDALQKRHGNPIARAAAAWLCRRHTEAPLRELAGLLGLSRADCVPNLTRMLDRRLKDDLALADELRAISDSLEPEPVDPTILEPSPLAEPISPRQQKVTRKTKNKT
ncbi:REP-associated tyrosine transposase [Aquisphaera insulae]|uniref:REP-associated tyrosine transposase n=1 Tax=Aquisphaera insulae TaxID=2712864 RepID=UPI0013E99E92|nr:transposase [Aquisphaera insulae]